MKVTKKMATEAELLTQDTDRRVLHMDMDTFFISVERLRNPTLQNRPVIVGGQSDRAVVSSCSYETRPYGVHSGMAIKMARQLCPQAIVVKGDWEAYSHYSRMVTDVIADQAPVYEKASIDEHYLDLTGMDRFHGCLKWSHELRQRIIRETGLPISFGLSNNKCLAKMATRESKPNGELQVLPQQVPHFLEPLSIKKIPMLGEKTYQQMRSMGIAQVGTLAQMPLTLMRYAFGQHGVMLWQRAHGVDHSPVETYNEQKSISKEHTLETDTTDPVLLDQLLSHMATHLGFELRRKQRLSACITLRIRYANFDTHTHQHRVPYTASDHDLLQHARELLSKLWQRRLRIRLIGLRCSALVPGVPQADLFDPMPHRYELYHAMDHIRGKYGKGSLQPLTSWQPKAAVVTASTAPSTQQVQAQQLLMQRLQRSYYHQW